jgi:hypothetical protein
MADYSALDRHILSFKGSPFVSTQRDVKFVAGGENMSQLSYYFSFEGQIKEVVFDLNDLNIHFDAIKQKLVQGKMNARHFEISVMTLGDATVLIDFDFQVLCQFKINEGVLHTAGETFENQTAEFQLNLKALRQDSTLRVSN